MGIIQYFVLVVIVGLVVAMIQWWAPIDARFKAIVLWVGVAFCILVLLFAVGILPLGTDHQIPKVR